MLDEVDELTGETLGSLFAHWATLDDNGPRRCRLSPGAFRGVVQLAQSGRLPSNVTLIELTSRAMRFEVAGVGVVVANTRAPTMVHEAFAAACWQLLDAK